MKKIFISILIISIVGPLIGGAFFLTAGFQKFDKNEMVKNAKIGYLIGQNAYLTITKQRCSQPIKYSLGTIDDKFGISREDLLHTLEEAEKIWEEDITQNLFEYDPEATLKINLIYDERQKINQEKKRLEEYTKEVEEKMDKAEAEYLKMEKEYNQLYDYLVSAGNKLSEDIYQYELKAIDYKYGWEYSKRERKKLKKERDALNARRDKLLKQENYLNSLAGKLNGLAAEGKQLTEEYNKKVDEFNEKYEMEIDRDFESGEYSRQVDNQEINIYAFWDQRDLKMILAHELGHALGIEHVQNPRALMYYLNKDQEKDFKLTTEDMTALKEACDFQN